MIPLTRAVRCLGLALALLGGVTRPLSAQDLAGTVGGERGLPFFEIFEPREYGGHPQIWSAVESRSGVMYFGNLDRVLIFDGARWSHFDVPNATFVRALGFDGADTLWVGGVNELGYAKTDAAGLRTFVSLKDQLPAPAREPGEIWCVLLTPRGPLFQSNNWLLRWDGQKFATLALTQAAGWQALLAGEMTVISNPRHGWFQLIDDGQSLVLQPLPRPAGYEGTALRMIVPTLQPGKFIFCTGRFGLLRWDGQNFTKLPTDADEILMTKRNYRSCPLPEGYFCISTLQAGLLIFDSEGRLQLQLDERGGLPDNTVIDVHADRQGALWACLDRGVARIDIRPWLSTLGALNGLPRSQFSTLRFQNATYAASTTGLLRIEPGTARDPAKAVPIPEVREFLSSLVDAGDVLIGLSEHGIWQWPAPTPTERQIADLSNATAFGPLRSQPGRWIAIANEQPYSFRREGRRWIAEGKIPGIDHARSVHEDDAGALWFGLSTKGVLKVTLPAAGPTSPGEPVIERFGVAQGLPVGHGWVRLMWVKGRLLLSCQKGIYRLDAGGQRFVASSEFGERFADGSTTARSLVEDEQGGTWILARPAGRLELATPIEIGRHDATGWRALRLPQLLKFDEGVDIRIDRDVLWIAGHGGIIRVDLALWRKAPPEPAPELLLCAATASDNTPLPLAGGWSLPFARRSLSLSFASPSLVKDPLAVYESTLQLGSESSQRVDRTPERTFNALGAGDYTLRLRARSGDGRWSEPVRLAFSILPPWWLSGWAWLGYAAMLGLVVVGGVRQRTHALERRAAQLESVVQVRTEELRNSNVELARLHRLELDERIAARLGEEKARLEVLRYQLNPHFLFNALTSVRAQLPGTLTAARQTIGQLTEFCRSTLLQPASGDFPTLSQEMEMLSAYLAIEKTRWGDLLEVETEIAPAAGEVPVPSLLLLPLVENALKYGRATSPETLKVRLAARFEGECLLVEVANTGTWVKPEERADLPSLGIGMENLRQRLQRFYPDRHAFETQAEDGWVRMRLRLRGEPVTRGTV